MKLAIRSILAILVFLGYANVEAKDYKEEIDLSLLNYNGRLAYQTYLSLYEYKDGWWWNERVLTGDGDFGVEDFVTLVLYQELFSNHESDIYYDAWTEALSRSSIEWKRYSREGLQTDLGTDEGLLNWIFAQSGTGRRTYKSFIRDYYSTYALVMAQTALRMIISPMSYGHYDWINGCEELDRPCYVGSNAPGIQLSYINRFYERGCPSFLLYGGCNDPSVSNFTFILTRRQAIELGW